jgi:anhydro-N-acetylmuramic acid kinase
MDGIDAALVDVSTQRLIKGITIPYREQTKCALLQFLSQGNMGPARQSQLNTQIGEDFALAVLELIRQANITYEHIEAIGSHGQTICHDATEKVPYTVQLGCAHTIAEKTKITVVADFRTRDLVIGGQGAPYAPIYHQAIFEHEAHPLAVVNIGGISNVTFLDHHMGVSGYDVGPGNALLDFLASQHLHALYDECGMWAATGTMQELLLSLLLEDTYFKQVAPKSVGKEYFSHEWLQQYLTQDYAPTDLQRTLVELTAVVIARAIKKYPLSIKRLLVCGGGVHNTFLMSILARELPSTLVTSTQTVGIDPDYIEAMMFAWLADKALNKCPLDFSVITGASHPAVYGAIYPAGIDKINSLKV